ncbi:mannose-6-phosphate isomerase [Euwallacea fornicatus]|uniref:mannose-6-phosphate isomerase n=1 Tax=Euwallacea fornicatus TaxID=995702 RepID=UPI00339059D6
MELQCKVQNYEWGKKGLLSKVAQLRKSADTSFEVEDHLPYAELWMGTHVNAPSIIKATKENLSDLLCRHPEYLGNEVLRQFNQLPFLFKVLSVSKALSIQAHPSKKHAEQLHAQFPEIYKDPNHKPEMAIALTEFEALCGFRPWSEIKTFISNISELQDIFKNIQNTDDGQLIQEAFWEVLNCSKAKILDVINSLLTRFKESSKSERDFLCADLVEKLHSQYPFDNGILMVYFLNYIKLRPSEAIFLGANEPHAYLFGDCIECMACSDNVVRAGLTPKFIDVNTLCGMLNYEGAPSQEKLYSPLKEDDFSVIYKPPVPDFSIVQIEVPASEESFTVRERSSASILLIISGKSLIKTIYGEQTVSPGSVLFLPADQTIIFDNFKDPLLIYQALANV